MSATMLRWLSSKHRRSSSSSASSMHRISLELPADMHAHVDTCSNNSKQVGDKSSPRSASGADSCVPRGKNLGSLRRRSLPALHLQEDQSAAMMSNPPVFSNPLRRRGCCDHQHTEQVSITRGLWQHDATLSDQCPTCASQLVEQMHSLPIWRMVSA